MPERKNAKLAKAMSNHEAPFRVVFSGRQTEVRSGLWESEVYQFYDACMNGIFCVYNTNFVLIYSQAIM